MLRLTYTSICVLYSVYVLVSMYKLYKKSNISGIVFWGFTAHIDIIKNAMVIKRGTTMKGNRNTKRVTVKANRNCWHCNKMIPRGTICLTVNPKGYGRHWLCNDCVSLYNSIVDAKCSLDSVPFDDEGAAYANADYLDEKVSEWKDCQYGEDTILDKRVYSLVN